MPSSETTASAPGKIILIGEHSVVYGRPAIALPISWLRTRASIVPRDDARIEVIAPDIDTRFWLDEAPGRPLGRIITLTRERLGISTDAGFALTVQSDLPVGSHLGSGAAVSVAAARAVATFYGHTLSADDASALAFEIEKQHHGIPSGVDNTVIAHEQPVWFIKGQPHELLSLAFPEQDQQALPADPVLGQPLHALMQRLVIADTGFSTPTKTVVAEVRAGWQENKLRHEAWFDEIEGVAFHARMALFDADWPALGMMMTHNHEVLQELNVSCPELDALCSAALEAGALGAKLSGGGRGGNIITLAQSKTHAADLAHALLQAGAHKVFAQSLT